MQDSSWWAWLAGGVTVMTVAVSVYAVTHVVLNKRDVRAAIGWTGLIVVNPLIGAVVYYLFGINRIRRRAARMSERRQPRHVTAGSGAGSFVGVEAVNGPDAALSTEALAGRTTAAGRAIARILQGTPVSDPILAGNTVEPLVQGDVAYPAMLEAIGAAQRSVALASYIMDNDAAGKRFVEALAAAVTRGVQVRVLLDGVGVRYSRPRITPVLRRRGVCTAEFLSTRVPWPSAYTNLRNHRKLLIVDGETAFAGGMNIREGCLLETRPPNPVQDIHFELQGPIVEQLFEIFAEDWSFATGEQLHGPAWECSRRQVGDSCCRAIADGPDEDFETLRWAMLAATASAEHSIRIVTPYFLPEQPMITALQLAALRGVQVDIVLPETSNLRFVQWASTAQLWQVIEPGCRVWATPPPFDHSKVMVVDDAWALIGSANWDPRSLRLNFEVGVECYDMRFAGELSNWVSDRIAAATPVTLQDLSGRSTLARLRDGVARLLAPYL